MKQNIYKTPQEELGMTDEEIHADLIAQGLDPAEEVEALRNMARNMRSMLPPIGSPTERLSTLANKRFALFEEAVSAGSASPAAHDDVNESSLADILTKADQAACIWVHVCGDSMRDAGIKHGDVVLVDTKQRPKSGDIVVAHVAPHGQVVKRLEICTDGTAKLHSENPAFSALLIKDAELVNIRGVVVARAGGI